MSATSSDQRTPDCVEEGIDTEHDSINIIEETFLGSSCVTSMGIIQTTFLVEKELVPIKIEKISSNYYALFKLVFII